MNNNKQLLEAKDDYEYISIEESKPYEFDFDKVNTLDDVIAILKGLDITIYSGCKPFDKLKPYLKPKDNE